MSNAGGKLTYYDASDGIYACRGDGWSVELFRLIKGDPPQWKYLPKANPAYGIVHHEIFMTLHTDEIRKSDLPAGTPEVPETPDISQIPVETYRSKEAYFLPKQPLATKDYPRLSRLVARTIDKRIVCWVVLDDDKLGLAWGDERYAMLHSAHLSREEAEQRIRADDDGTLVFAITELTVAIEGEAFGFPGFRLGLWNNYHPAEVVAALEDHLAAVDEQAEPT
jgi:hypothetical protein